ncbi:MAG TPA: SNF2-related protein [Methylococcus sp.]|nr:SNF2-related protein [Methylococcus sp.]
MRAEELKPNITVHGPLFPEPVQVIVAIPMGASVKLVGKGTQSNSVYEPILTAEQLALLTASPAFEPFDGDARKFRLGIEAMRLGLAYEYDPYFSLSIARVDPLPHQLEAVYDYFMKLPRIRFLLADDPGAGKTIMAGLLIKELKIRGLVKRVLIITPANLTFQWQRELKDKFRENFEVIRSDVLRANYGMNPWQEKDQVVTSVSWVSRIEDAKDSLLRSRWDLVIVDEAHKMSAYSSEKKTLAYQLGEALSHMTDHYLLMTATPHKGDPENFCLFLELLDRDVYGDIRSLEEAMVRHEAPFYLRRVKEALVTFPEPDNFAGSEIGQPEAARRGCATDGAHQSAQVLVATEAAGEGINLQFCWLMINYDIPWNPVRLEQRMGRIHRYGQEKDCLIFNFVSTNTREGRVLHKLFERIEAIQDDLDPKRTGKIFNVLGDVFPANRLEKMLRDMYAHNQMPEEFIK